MKMLLSICLMVAVMSIPASAVVIGDWESGLDGWIDWSGGSGTLTPGATAGVTLGSGSLRVDQSGWGQTLAIKLQDNGLVGDFLANSIFSIDVSVAANDGTVTGGYSQVYAVSMNAEGAGWQDVASGTPVNFYWWEGSGERTETLTIDYSAYKAAVPANPGWVEIIFALNTGGGAPTDMYFDNAQLTVPEPATLSVLGLGALALLRRKK